MYALISKLQALTPDKRPSLLNLKEYSMTKSARFFESMTWKQKERKKERMRESGYEVIKERKKNRE
jgi:hypothetical protein